MHGVHMQIKFILQLLLQLQSKSTLKTLNQQEKKKRK